MQLPKFINTIMRQYLAFQRFKYIEPDRDLVRLPVIYRGKDPVPPGQGESFPHPVCLHLNCLLIL